MPKYYTHIHEITFGVTTVLSEEDTEGLLLNLKASIADTEKFSQLPIKEQVFAKLMKEAFDKEGYEGFIRELTRYSLRTGIADILQTEIGGITGCKVSPLKVVSVAKGGLGE